jgi:hypothetical protein
VSWPPACKDVSLEAGECLLVKTCRSIVIYMGLGILFYFHLTALYSKEKIVIS